MDPGKAHAALVKINPETGRLFEQALPHVTRELTREELTRWCHYCVHLSSAGWRSFEATNLYLELTNIILAREGSPTLLRIGAHGADLAGYSYEPPLRYFAGSQRLINNDNAQALPLIEDGGKQLYAQYEHATGLMTNYYASAFHVASTTTMVELTKWIGTTVNLLTATRDELLKFLEKSRESDTFPYSFLALLQPANTASCLTYMNVHEVLIAGLGESNLLALQGLLERFKSKDLSPLLTVLHDQVRSRTNTMRQWHTLVALGGLIDDAELFELLLTQRPRLPIDDKQLLNAWLEKGMLLYRGKPKAMTAYIKIESAVSEEVLASLRSQVEYKDWQQVFDLLAESIIPASVRIEVGKEKTGARVENPDDGYRPRMMNLLPATDGKTLFLPEVVNQFKTRADNFGFYKTSLLHQLGYHEFGCFPRIAHVSRVIGEFADRPLASYLFTILEDARIDWQLAFRFPGMVQQLKIQKAHASSQRQPRFLTPRRLLMEVILAVGLDADYKRIFDDVRFAGVAGPELALLKKGANELAALVQLLTVRQASVLTTLDVLAHVYEIIRNTSTGNLTGVQPQMSEADLANALAELGEPVAFRGELDVQTVEATLKLEAIVEALDDSLEKTPEADQPAGTQLLDPEFMDFDNLKKGDSGAGVGVELDDLSRELNLVDEPELLSSAEGKGWQEYTGQISSKYLEASVHLYDEWDFEIGDYRPRWCTLYERREVDEDADYVPETLRAHQALARRVRGQLNNLRPEMMVKVKGVAEGEELDLERSVAYMVDRKAGLTPTENIYVQRQRKERDVSTLFLLDMSASTDDILRDPSTEPKMPDNEDDENLLARFFEDKKRYEENARRIIDLEKESVVLMADALERLGDSYSVCGFSGYGRERIDYYLCKDFDDPFDARSKARIGGIKPARSTRMGPPIRHATRRLLQTGSRIKALIIISDGYPQDHDYGSDRNSRDYGLKDTMKALSEARQQGVLSYCLTVDPSGHDYLRAMCPDSQYMVISDIEQLPEELSRVYRSLTG